MEKEENGNQYFYEALIYGEKNGERMKDYHRLDLGLSYVKYTLRGNKAIWNFSVYNAYNRHNPNYYYYNTNASSEIYNPEEWSVFKPLKLYQFSLFPIIPTLSYKVFFDSSYSKKDMQKTTSKQKPTFKQKFKNWIYQTN